MDDIARLLRRIRRLELLALALLASCAGVALTASHSAAPPTVRAERFEMVDADARVRGYWRMTDDGSPALTLYDDHGRARVAMYAAPVGASEVTVTNAEGVSLRVRIEADGSTQYGTSSR